MPDNIKQEVADWIDDDVIAEQIIETLKDEDISPTLEHCQKVWLDFQYTELPVGIRSSVQALADKGDFV
ncbi:unnamed protein product [marine sediment metagenome]|uniref:Uncharacterized protein n=1 Tax=marine sediment metagenome TaxID=412755 RepID=X1LT71_9ZZZZ